MLDIFAARLCDMLSRKPQDISDLWAVDERGSIAAVVSKDDELRRTKPIIVAKPSSPPVRGIQAYSHQSLLRYLQGRR